MPRVWLAVSMAVVVLSAVLQPATSIESACSAMQPEKQFATFGLLSAGGTNATLSGEDSHCSWWLFLPTPDASKVYKLTVNWLQLPGDCTDNHLQVSDDSTGLQVLADFCSNNGEAPFPPVYSSGDSMMINMYFEGAPLDAGVVMMYETLNRADIPSPSPSPSPTPSAIPGASHGSASHDASSSVTGTASPSPSFLPAPASASATPSPSITPSQGGWAPGPGTSSATATPTATPSGSGTSVGPSSLYSNSASPSPSLSSSTSPSGFPSPGSFLASTTASHSCSASASPSAFALPSASPSPSSSFSSYASPTPTPTLTPSAFPPSSSSAPSTTPLPSFTPSPSSMPSPSSPPTPGDPSPTPSSSPSTPPAFQPSTGPRAAASMPPRPDSTRPISIFHNQLAADSWRTDPASSASDLNSALATALGVSAGRFVVVFPSSSCAPDTCHVTIQVLHPVVPDEPSMYDLSSALFGQLLEPDSAVRLSPAARVLASEPPAVVFENPASFRITPGTIRFEVESRQSLSSSQEAEVFNDGGATLVVTNVVQVPDSAPWLRFAPTSFSVPGGESRTVRFVVVPSGLPPSDSVDLQVVEFEHNVPSGPHAIGVEVYLADGGGSKPTPTTPSSSGIFHDPHFIYGVIAATAVLFALFLLGCWCKRKCCGPKGRPNGGFQKIDSARAGVRPDKPRAGSDSKEGDDDDVGESGVELSEVRVAGPSDSSERSERSGAAGGRFGSSSGPSSASTGRGNSSPTSDGSGNRMNTKGGSAGGGARSDRGGSSGGGGGMSSSGSNSRRTSTPGPSSSSRPPSLKAKPVLRAEEFDTKWNSLATCELWGASLVHLPAEDEIEALLAPCHIACLASGTLGDVQKFYFFAEDTKGPLYMCELSIIKSSLRMSVIVKGPSQESGASFSTLLKSRLEGITK